MAVIYDTTMSPSKLELLAAWLPAQPWYLDTGHEPELSKSGGFRLDDPQGEVGIEFMVVTDRSGERATTYQVPLTYRARALASAASWRRPDGAQVRGVLATAQYTHVRPAPHLGPPYSILTSTALPEGPER